MSVPGSVVKRDVLRRRARRRSAWSVHPARSASALGRWCGVSICMAPIVSRPAPGVVRPGARSLHVGGRIWRPSKYVGWRTRVGGRPSLPCDWMHHATVISRQGFPRGASCMTPALRSRASRCLPCGLSPRSSSGQPTPRFAITIPSRQPGCRRRAAAARRAGRAARSSPPPGDGHVDHVHRCARPARRPVRLHQPDRLLLPGRRSVGIVAPGG